jgi:hypothetical protein
VDDTESTAKFAEMLGLTLGDLEEEDADVQQGEQQELRRLKENLKQPVAPGSPFTTEQVGCAGCAVGVLSTNGLVPSHGEVCVQAQAWSERGTAHLLTQASGQCPNVRAGSRQLPCRQHSHVFIPAASVPQVAVIQLLEKRAARVQDTYFNRQCAFNHKLLGPGNNYPRSAYLMEKLVGVKDPRTVQVGCSMLPWRAAVNRR